MRGSKICEDKVYDDFYGIFTSSPPLAELETLAVHGWRSATIRLQF